jgi:hypothetical protein
MAGASVTFDSVPPQFGNEAVHEFSALRKISITQAKEVMTGDHDPTTGSPLQQPHRIVAEARCFSAIAQLLVDGQSDDHRIYVRGQ